MDFALAVLVLLSVLQVNDSGELISGNAHFQGRIEIDSTKSPATADVGKKTLMHKGVPRGPRTCVTPGLLSMVPHLLA